jgi:alpha-ketoglutaric semialdehyde dehydrogenase
MVHKILVGGGWREPRDPTGTFRAMDPATGTVLPDEYPVSSWADLEMALAAGAEATFALAEAGPDRLAAFLEAAAAGLERRADTLVEMARLETGLPAEPRLRSSELPRTTGQLRQAAAACRDRSWCRATIDTKLDIRSKLGVLGGPVAVFGPSNFPFAFNAAGGGDFAAALAAGNTVIAKANPHSPGTTRLMAEAAFEALDESGLPTAAVQLLYHCSTEDGRKLVSHPLLGATAFTGSRTAGMGLKEAADKAGKPIYLEMSSINPVFVLPGAVRERGQDVASELFASCTAGEGQFCTKPGLIICVESPENEGFLNGLAAAFDAAPPGVLLGRGVLKGLEAGVERLRRLGADLTAGRGTAEGPGFRFRPALFRVSGALFLQAHALFQIESFGALTLLVAVRDLREMGTVAAALEGQLTATVFSARDGSDEPAYAALEPIVRRKAGRLLNDKVPTGVAVSPAMNHGGPFPAAGHPRFTSVGLPAALTRFAALPCYDNVRQDRLPPELKNGNPTGRMWRLIDGEWTQRSL